MSVSPGGGVQTGIAARRTANLRTARMSREKYFELLEQVR